jgi:signal peptidase II
MAFGMQLPGQNGKILLTLLRVIIISGIGYYMVVLIKKHSPIPLLITLSLIFAGAAGNLIDCLFYGLIFTKSPEIYTIGQSILPATTTQFGHGYSSFLFGNVVDMIYFPLFSIKIPNFIPLWGGSNFSFFDPIFNIADASITCGVFILLFFSRKWFRTLEAIDNKQKQQENSEVVNN